MDFHVSKILAKNNKFTLNELAQDLHGKLKEQPQIDFVNGTETNNEDSVLQLKFDIVLHIINVLKAERDAAVVREQARSEVERLKQLLQDAENRDLSNKSVEDLRAMLAAAQAKLAAQATPN
ncbi:hypothetical protein [Neisseria bergeri]|uniref:hypothetical protein n=1 Tax=Neisseria bergeri TaxID=1906581 RepID=UPI0027DF83FB|nr:hypothetical protein [Neisseria bergeri]